LVKFQIFCQKYFLSKFLTSVCSRLGVDSTHTHTHTHTYTHINIYFLFCTEPRIGRNRPWHWAIQKALTCISETKQAGLLSL